MNPLSVNALNPDSLNPDSLNPESNTPLPPKNFGGDVADVANTRTAKSPIAEFTPGFTEFWQTWPSSDRKQAKSKCFEVWKKAKAEANAALVCGHVSRMKSSTSWTKQNGEFVPAPLVYLKNQSWDGADDDGVGSSGILQGAI